jgi:hypothetical protein
MFQKCILPHLLFTFFAAAPIGYFLIMVGFFRLGGFSCLKGVFSTEIFRIGYVCLLCGNGKNYFSVEKTRLQNAKVGLDGSKIAYIVVASAFVGIDPLFGAGGPVPPAPVSGKRKEPK